MKLKKFASLIGIMALPALVSAATIVTALEQIKQILNAIIPIVITLAVIYFFWGLAQYILGGVDSPEKKEAGRNIMIYGLIALFVMVSVWGLVGLIGGTFGVGQGGSVSLPQI